MLAIQKGLITILQSLKITTFLYSSSKNLVSAPITLVNTMKLLRKLPNKRKFRRSSKMNTKCSADFTN